MKYIIYIFYLGSSAIFLIFQCLSFPQLFGAIFNQAPRLLRWKMARLVWGFC